MIKKPLFRKGFVITLVGIFIIISFSPLVSSIVKIEKNMEIVYGRRNSLSGYGTVCGYITDVQTSLPIENATVDIQRRYKYWNHTYTDSTGFYNISVPSGNYTRVYAHADGYCSKYGGNDWLEENETIWINVSLLPRPPETSIIFGYVSDKDTGELMEDVEVELIWRDENWNRYTNYTYTNSSGFYCMNVAAGLMRLYASAPLEGYFHEWWPKSDFYYMGENETKQANITMYPIPPENSIVCGYINDSKTSDPIESALVHLQWQDGHGHGFYYDNFTDSFGFYNMSVAEGIVSIESISKKGYWAGWTPSYDISENETLWLNESLDLRSPENAIVCGNITDYETGEPIEHAGIHLDWKDREGHVDWNWTNTNASGFYSMNIAEGKIKLTVYKNGYYERELGWYDIEEHQIRWLDIKMWRPGRPSSPTITGPWIGKAGVDYDYDFSSTDDGGYVWYFIDWGDNTSTTWHGPYESGETITFNHIWTEKGKYTIKAKVKDIDDRESEWRLTEANMWFLWWLERFPILNQIVNLLIERWI